MGNGSVEEAVVFGMQNDISVYCPSNDDKFLDGLKSLSPGLVLDIGALNGEDAVLYARAGHEVISFEAVPTKAETIRKTIEAAGEDVAKKN